MGLIPKSKPFPFITLAVGILFSFSPLNAADEEEIEVDQSYLLEVENRKASVLEAERMVEVMQSEIQKLELQREDLQSVVDSQNKNIEVKETEVNAQREILQEKLDELLIEEAKKTQFEQDVLRKETEIDAKRVELADQAQEVDERKKMVEQAIAEVNKQKQLILEQKEAEDRESRKRKLLTELEQIRAQLGELGVSFAGAIAGAGGQAQEEEILINSKLKQCERNTNLVDNRDGTISDRSTDLMWQKCSLGEKYDSDSNICLLYAMASNTYNINERLRLFNREQEFLNRYSRDRGGSSYYSDWRLPTITELKTLIKEPCAQDPTYYYGSLFEATKEDLYLTSSLTNSGEVVFLDFKNGQVKNDIPESSGYIRLVR